MLFLLGISILIHANYDYYCTTYCRADHLPQRALSQSTFQCRFSCALTHPAISNPILLVLWIRHDSTIRRQWFSVTIVPP